MSLHAPALPDVFSVREVARAAGVPSSDIRALIASGGLRVERGGFIAGADAIHTVRLLRGGGLGRPDELFRTPAPTARSPLGALAASGALHAAMLAGLVLLATFGAATPRAETQEPVRMVFLALPGPGGGGGGGGLRQPTPPARTALKGTAPLRSPIPPSAPVKRPPAPAQAVKPEPAPVPISPPVEAPRATPPPEMPKVAAPVATAAADPADTPGIVSDPTPAPPSQGQGAGGGAGTGNGTGLGEGNGAGIGPGSGGGTGGGPYRPGTGITPPAVQREVKPDYTEEARRRGIAGDVVLEIVVRSDGGVGSVRLLQGLGGGLDQRAIDAVRQWRFSPARRFGVPVDVLVEIAVEFKLR